MTYIFTQSKGKFYFENPSDYFSEISALDFYHEVGYALNNVCRYAGHCTQFYSVLSHTLLGVKVLEQYQQVILRIIQDKIPIPDIERHVVWRSLMTCWLLHDASEAYLGDVPSPLKGLLPDYREIEKSVQSGIEEKFYYHNSGDINVSGLDEIIRDIAKRVDTAMLCAEKKLLTKDMQEWLGLEDFLKDDFNRQLANEAYEVLAAFLEQSKTPSSDNRSPASQYAHKLHTHNVSSFAK